MPLYARILKSEVEKEAASFCPDCNSMIKDEYCTNKNCDKSKDAEKARKKDEKERKRDEKINITYDNGKAGDSVLIKFINNVNGREYWSAQERKSTYPDSWVETKINELQKQLETNDKRVPQPMRDDNKMGDTFSVEYEIYEGRGAFDHANNQLVELGDKAYHIMKKSPKNPHDPNLDRTMEDDELLVPTASIKRLIRKEADKSEFKDLTCHDCQGTGEISYDPDDEAYGTTDPCETCDGTGMVQTYKGMQVIK